MSDSGLIQVICFIPPSGEVAFVVEELYQQHRPGQPVAHILLEHWRFNLEPARIDYYAKQKPLGGAVRLFMTFDDFENLPENPEWVRVP